MTSLTIELTPDIYERLRAEAQRQGKAEQMLAQELLTGQLQKEAPLDPTLAPEVQALLAIMKDTNMIVPPQGTSEDAIRLLQSWSEEDTASEEEQGEGTWEDMLRAIDAKRRS